MSDRIITIETDPEINLRVKIYGNLKNDLVLFHHGAGYTAETWNPLISQLQSKLTDVCFVSFDVRGHGKSSKCQDFSLQKLVGDTIAVLKSVMMASDQSTIEVYLIGHSLGAAVMAALPSHFPHPNTKFSGLFMIDIIEETANNSLSRMPIIIQDIPKSFKSIEMALKWTLTTSHSHHFPTLSPKTVDTIKSSLKSQLYLNPETGHLNWITDLSLMQPYWDSWFSGLTDNFLNFPGSRILVLANTDYMDRDMIVAQMQGKFQLVIIRESGHAIQEDKCDDLAESVSETIQKHLKLANILRNK